MAWNDPGNQNPWGKGKRGGEQGPPDLDEMIEIMHQRFGKFLNKGKGNGNGGDDNDNGGGNSRQPRRLGPLLGLFFVLIVLVWGLWGFYIVEQAERGVILRLGVYHDTTMPGIHWRAPVIDRKYIVNIEAVRDFKNNALMLTQDENIVDIDLNVQYRIKDAKDYILNVRQPDNTIRHVAESALRQVVGNSLLNNVIAEGRALVSQDTKQIMQTLLDNYGTGLVVEQVNMQKASPPEAVVAAFDDVIKAREDKERSINQAQAYANEIIPRAKGKAQRLLAEAEAYKQQVIAQSEGEAQRFSALLTEYRKAPEVTRKRLYLDTVEQVMAESSKVVVDVEGGNQLLYLPIEQLANMSRKHDNSNHDEIAPEDIKVPELTPQAEQPMERQSNRRSRRLLR